MSTYQELKAQAEAILKQAEELRKSETATVIGDIRKKMSEYGLSVSDIFPTPTPKKQKGARAAITGDYYTGPDGSKWSGRGRPPAWYLSAKSKGDTPQKTVVL